MRTSALLLILLGVASVAAAQTAADPPRGNVSFFGVFAASASDGLDRGHGGGLSATYFFTDLLGVEGSYRRQSFDVTATTDNTLSGGTLAANVIAVNGVVRVASGSIQPYVSGGVVFYGNNYTLDPTVQQEL
ncbi:MAG: outer membrane beta-barrel protein, partial [Planctomycetota bacterium]